MLLYGTMSSNLGGEVHTSFVDELFLMDALKGVWKEWNVTCMGVDITDCLNEWKHPTERQIENIRSK